MNQFSTSRRRAMIVLGATLCALIVSTAAGSAADALPKTGKFSLRYTLVNPTTSAFGPTARGAAAADGSTDAGDWVGWIMSNDGSDGFGHKMTSRCAMIFKQNSTGVDVVIGDCVLTDHDGDKLFEKLDGFKSSWTGGTGKYAGISGDFDLTDVVVSGDSGYELVSGVKVGSYTIK